FSTLTRSATNEIYTLSLHDALPIYKSIIITVYEDGTTLSCTRVKNIPPYAINFSIISAVSKASWNAIEERWTIEQIAKEIENIKDRKSTRLNSSHVKISYAVFCLKK